MIQSTRKPVRGGRHERGMSKISRIKLFKMKHLQKKTVAVIAKECGTSTTTICDFMRHWHLAKLKECDLEYMRLKKLALG